MAEDPEQPEEPRSRLPLLVGFAVVVALVLAAYWLTTALRQNAKLEDCLMSGRTNCAPIEAPASGR